MLCVLLAAVLPLAGLTACGPIVPEDGIKAAEEMIAAALVSQTAELYYYKETRYALRDEAGKIVSPTRYTEVNLWADADSKGELIYDTSGGEKALKDFKAKVFRKVNNKSDIQFISGLSKGETDTTFFWNWDEDGKATLTRYAAARGEFLSSGLFAPYSLAAKVAELAEIRPQELDFSGDKAKIKRNGELIALAFTVRPEYFERIGEKSSLLRDATHIEVEVTYGRIQKLSVFRPAGGWMKEEESYTNQIVYRGPKFDVPAYDSGDWKDIGATAELPKEV